MHSTSSYSILFSFVAISALFHCGQARFIMYGNHQDSSPDHTSPFSESNTDYLTSSNVLGPADFVDASTIRKAPVKRRLVVRLPFANNPDTEQLTRIYRSILIQQKQKKVKPFNLPLSNFFQ